MRSRTCSFFAYDKSSIKFPAGLIFKPIWEAGGGGGGGGLIEMRDLFERGGLFNLEKTMVSVLHKELEYKVEKLENKKVGGHARFNLVRLKF